MGRCGLLVGSGGWVWLVDRIRWVGGLVGRIRWVGVACW